MKTGYKVGEVMTHRPIIIGTDANLVACVDLMKRNHVGALLVSEKDELKGILTEQDIVHKLVGENRVANESKVAEIMEGTVNTVTPDQDIFEALMMMRNLNIRHLPVIEGGRLVGLLTLKDILKIQPQLFDLIVSKFELREEENKPINNIGDEEGICNICGNYSPKLKFRDEIAMCEECMKKE